MREGLKYAWITFSVGCFLAFLLALIPFEKMQKAYMKEFHRHRNEPQRRVDETYDYVENVGAGKTNVSVLKFYKDLQKDDTQKESPKPFKLVRKYKKPLYVRDKKNPKIIRPYQRERYFMFDRH